MRKQRRKQKFKNRTVSYNEESQLHRDDDLPAIEYSNGTKAWYQNGLLHRDNDLPAIVSSTGIKEYFQYGKHHRLNGPAIEWNNGDKEWFQNGQLHRLNGPARERFNGTKEWYHHGKYIKCSSQEEGKFHQNEDLSTIEWKNAAKRQFLLKNVWIQVNSGKKFFPLEPRKEDIDINDIAHSLSMLCRFTGHSHYFYSVAQHSVMVSHLSGEHALAGLLHDASEAYMGDLNSPLKNSGEFESYKKYERNLQGMIFEKFGLPSIENEIVKRADLIMLATEARDLIGPVHPEWKINYEPLPMTICPLNPADAKKLFLHRFEDLNGKK